VYDREKVIPHFTCQFCKDWVRLNSNSNIVILKEVIRENSNILSAWNVTYTNLWKIGKSNFMKLKLETGFE